MQQPCQWALSQFVWSKLRELGWWKGVDGEARANGQKLQTTVGGNRKMDEGIFQTLTDAFFEGRDDFCHFGSKPWLG